MARLFEERTQIDRVEVIQTDILAITTSKDVHAAAYETRGMKTPSTRCISISFDFLPSEGSDVVDPEITQIICGLSSEDG